MKKYGYLLLLLFVVSCAGKGVEAVWYEDDPYTLVIRNLPQGVKDWTIWFSTPAIKKFELDSLSTARMLEVEGNFYRIIPLEGSSALADSVVIKYRTGSCLRFRAGAPEGFSFQIGDKQARFIPVKYVFKPLPADAERVAAFTSKQRYVEPALTDMIPALKQITPLEGEKVALPSSAKSLEVQIIPDAHPDGWYRLIIDTQGIRAESVERSGALYARVTLEHLIEAAGEKSLQPMIIEDWPDFPHRGLMLDPARHFVPGWKVKEYLRVMTRYKLNVLHLRLSDDDAWRLEIPEIPLLTERGSFRAIPQRGADGNYYETEALQPSYDGTISRSDTTRMANGYYSRDEFKSLLHYADSLCIRIVPEFDMPAHSRAVVHCVDNVTDPADTSVYTSPAGGYHRNCLDVSLEGTYSFVSTVLDNVISLYAEAGIPLPVVHLGGDEVAKGAWMGSPSCHRLLEKSGFDISRLSSDPSAPEEALTILRSYFTNRVLDIAKERGVKVAGWQELAGHLDDSTRKRLSFEAAWINYWKSKPEETHILLNDGFPVIISNGPNTYADEAYSFNKEEFGNGWAGPVDEKRTFALLPYDLYRSIRWDRWDNDLDLTNPGAGRVPLIGADHISGVQVQLFMGAAIRSYSDMEYMLFPKALGAFDRAWNAHPEWGKDAASADTFLEAFNRFYSIIIDREMPWYRTRGMRFHLPQPVIFAEDSVLKGYTPIPDAVIHYEFGSTTPSLSSPVLDNPVPIPASVDLITARTFYLGETSVSTTLQLK